MYEKLEECPSCKHTKFSNYKICKDFSVSTESFALVLCEKCKLIFTNPRPDETNIAKYYASEDYISHTNRANNFTNLLYKSVRNITLKQKVALIRTYTDKQQLLDYGCGTGTFLNHCKANDYIVSGYEPNAQASSIAADLLGQPIYTKPKHLKKSENYDVISAWHVIEHVHQLKDTLRLLRKKLNDDGYLFIALPNPNSFDAKHYQQYWAAYDVPRHLYHFTRDSFTLLAKKCKLKIKEIHPMKFDSYYVSLLSEKYMTGKSNFKQAFNIGKQSNKHAAANGEYSSLIYVLTK